MGQRQAHRRAPSVRRRSWSTGEPGRRRIRGPQGDFRCARAPLRAVTHPMLRARHEQVDALALPSIQDGAMAGCMLRALGREVD